jgi:hypothetical protein
MVRYIYFIYNKVEGITFPNGKIVYVSHLFAVAKAEDLENGALQRYNQLFGCRDFIFSMAAHRFGLVEA